MSCLEGRACFHMSPQMTGSGHSVLCRHVCLVWPYCWLQLPRAEFGEQMCPFPQGSSPLLSGTAALLLFLTPRAEEAAQKGFAGRWQQPP